jgi:hypothetical protein
MTWTSPDGASSALTGRRMAFALALVAVGGALLRAAPLLAPGGSAAIDVNYDEGVYLTGSALLARGFLPYRDFVFVHPPGLLLFLLPITSGAHADPASFLTSARLLAIVLGALTIALVGIVTWRTFGPLAALAAALLYATHPETVHEDRGPFLEPLLNLLCLAMAAVWLNRRDGRLSAGRALAAGALLGLAFGVKLWAGIWLLGALATLPRDGRGRSAAGLLLGTAAGAALVIVPFALADPAGFLAQVVGFQGLRHSQGVASLGLRVGHMAAMSALALPAVVVVLSRWREAPPAGKLFTTVYLLTVASFLVSAVYFLRYTSYLAVSSSALGGFTIAWLDERVRRRREVVSMRPATLTLAVLLTATLCQSAAAFVNSLRYRSPWQLELRETLRSRVPGEACLLALEPGWGLLGGRLPSYSGRWKGAVDPHAWMVLTRLGGDDRALLDGSAAPSGEPQEELRGLLGGCRFLVVGGWGLSDETRDWLARGWVRRFPPSPAEGPDLWERTAGSP